MLSVTGTFIRRVFSPLERRVRKTKTHTYVCHPYPMLRCISSFTLNYLPAPYIIAKLYVWQCFPGRRVFFSGLGLMAAITPTRNPNPGQRTTLLVCRPPWADFPRSISPQLDYSSAGAGKVGVGCISPRAFRRRVVRCWHCHPIGCREQSSSENHPKWVS